MKQYKRDKSVRVLGIYTKLINGQAVRKVEEAEYYGVDERSIQRDIDSIRRYLQEEEGFNSLEYDRKNKGYYIKDLTRTKLTNGETLAVCKILLDSRAFVKEEMENIIGRLIACCVPMDNQRVVKELTRSELHHYVELRHKKRFLNMLWDIAQAIKRCRCIEISYTRLKDKKLVRRKVKPAAIMFSEFYFYLAAFIENEEVKKGFSVLNDSKPTIYRIDRIERIKVLEEGFDNILPNVFEEGEFRKRLQFMYSGKLRRVKFQYKGINIDAVLDRLPTAKANLQPDGSYIVSAQVYGDGIDMWLRSQGELVEIVE